MTDWSETQRVLDMAAEADEPDDEFIAKLAEFERARLREEGVLVTFEDEGEDG